MTDLFDEVEEQLRSDRYRTLALKALPWVLAIAAAALIVFLGFWGWDRYRQQSASQASESYQVGLEALSQGRVADAEKAFGDVAKSPSKAYQSLALMQLAGVKLGNGDNQGAVALLDKAADAAPHEIIGDVARLKSAFALLDTAPYKDLEARLTPLMKDGRPYRVQAREALAFAKLMAGDISGARADFVVISQTLDAPGGARARATAAKDLIDSGSAKAVPAAAKAAALLSPPTAAPAGPMLAPPASPPQAQAPGPQ